MQEIPVLKIKNNPGTQLSLEQAFNIVPKDFGYEEFLLAEPVALSGFVENNGNQLFVKAELKAKCLLVCSRCGGQFTLPLVCNFCEGYSQTPLADQEGENDIHQFFGDSINPATEVLQRIFLELPMKALCKEDCKGLCPDCGINLNLDSCNCAAEKIDPRLEKLKDFIIKD
ncbi:MAG: DUF177 domain-containing protein [Clostridia bacterium]|nr:DUF177 domain-containing protein [Clostridia bacterium]MDD4799003.1 DUF177 domain-containing protein [Clostridia bacterium]